MEPEAPAKQKLSAWQIVHTVASAALGVQSKKNLERDLTHGSPTVFIVAGILGVVLFVLAVTLVVRLVLQASGS